MTTTITELLTKRRNDAEFAARRLAESATDGILDDQNEVALEDALDTVVETDAALRAITQPAVKVRREPKTFERHSPHSYFLARAAVVSSTPLPGMDSGTAQKLLERHAAECDADGVANIRASVATAQMRDAGVVPTGGSVASPDGTIVQERTGDLVSTIAGGPPPVWILEEYATALYAASPLLKRIRTIALPPQCSSITIPAFDNSDVTFDPQTAENTAVDDVMGNTTSEVTHDVATFTGDTIISQQLSDRGLNFDQFVAQAFGEASAASIEAQVIAGSGTSNELLGLLSVSGIESIATTGAALGLTDFAASVAQVAGQVSDARNRMPSVVVMRGSRYLWLAGQPNSTGVTNQLLGSGQIPSDSDDSFYGPLAGLPVILSNGVPSNLGTGTNQDAVIVLRAQDLLVLLSDPTFTCWEQTYGNQLSVLLGVHGYCVSVPDRYPSGIGVLSGTGLVTPTWEG